MTYSEILNIGCLRLKTADISDYKYDATELLMYVTKSERADLLLKGPEQLDESLEKEYLELISKRESHIPLQHLTNVQGFMGLDFYVNQDVLIPRQDTETLVEEALKEICDGMRILDICTGSGCILLSLLHYTNDCSGVGADLSDAALAVATRNAKALGIDACFVQSDMFENVSDKFDIIVSNPPYIKESEIETLMPEVKDHDPYMALSGHEDGLFFYRILTDESRKHLNRGGFLMVEIGNEQGSEVSKLFSEAGFVDVKVIKDLCGNDRVVRGYYV